MHQLEQKKFDIRDHLDRLSPGKGKDKYVCPVCDGRNLQIESETGKYHCFTSDCENKAIREAIKPWAEVLAERGGNSDQHSSKRPIATKTNKKQPKPTPIPAGSKLLRLPAPQRGPEPQKPTYIPEGVPGSAVLITYSYSETQQVHRFEWLDPNEPKGRDKTCRQSHINDEGKVKWNKGDKPWPAYRIDEVVKTLKGVPDDEPVVVLMLEGEPNVELGRFHSIAGLTLQGSKWSDAEITRAVEALRATGKNITLGKLRDNDSTGVKKGSQIQSVCDRLQFPCIVIDPVAIYPDIPDKGDIKEILENMDIEEFIRRLEAEIHRQVAESARAIESEDIEEEPIDKPTHQEKLSMRDAAEMVKAILNSEEDEISINIKLEEVRQQTSLSNFTWEEKIVKPLKRDRDANRFKFELLALLQMEDMVERCRQIALMAPRYSMSAGTIKEAMSAMKSRTETAESRLWSLNEVFNFQSEGLQWIVPELLPCAETVILSASPKCGKSLLAVDLAFCTATGEEKFLGQNIKAGKVLLVSVDESLNSTRSKLLKRGFRSQDSDNLKVLPQWDITQTAKLEAFLEDYRPDVVIIDSLKRICKGSAVSENSAEFSDNIYALKELLTRYGAAGVLIHHSNKNADALGVDRLRGSSAIAGSVWGVWQVDHIPKKDPNNSKKLKIDPKDPKRIFSCFPRDAEGQTLDIELNLENNSWICHGLAGEDAEATQQRGTIRERILRTLEKHNRPLPGPEIIELALLAEQRGSAYSELNRMVGKKVISAAPAPGDKRYTLYSLPNCHAESLSVKSPPPPPPPISLPIAIYNSENHTEHGFQIDSKIDSTYIAIDSTVTVESEMLSIANDFEDRVSEIDSKLPLSQWGGEVKCVSVYNEAQPSEPGTIAPLKSKPTELTEPTDSPIAPSLQFTIGERVKVSPEYIGTKEFRGKLAAIIEVYSNGLCWIEFDSEIEISGCKPTKKTTIDGQYLVLETASPIAPPESDLNEDELELVEFVRSAIAENDPAAAKNVQGILTEVGSSDAADRSKVWGALTATEQAAFKALIAEFETPSKPEQLPHAPALSESEPQTPSEPIAPLESAPKQPTVNTQAHQLNLLPEFKPPSDSKNRFSPDSEDWA